MIVLSALNTKYYHVAFGLRCLYANLGELRTNTKILEFSASENTLDIAQAILRESPKILGVGVYIWNVDAVTRLVSTLKSISPELIIVLGGPEVSFETQDQPVAHHADFIICGEADLEFARFCRNYLADRQLPNTKWIFADPPELVALASPYPYYTEEDFKHRIVYVEASRGCPFRCEYCLSSLDTSVREFDTDIFLSEMEQLITRGARQFKFLDRTFNLNITTSTQILRFFLERTSLGLSLHFEMIPDRLPNELRDLIRRFPKNCIQLEIGVQTWNPEVATRISRRQNYEKIVDNFNFLTQETQVHIHADLIAGLPGETLESFAQGFDQLFALGPHEIQVGILKRLKGTPIARHSKEWGMVYDESPPYTVLRTSCMDFETLWQLNRFAQFWNLYASSGNFEQTLDLFRKLSRERSDHSFFWFFWEFTQFLNTRHAQGYGIALVNLVESAWIFLTQHLGLNGDDARPALLSDYCGRVKRSVPDFLRIPHAQ